MFDGWRIVDGDRPLGQGGFGVVYRAVHADLGLAVALKVMTHPSWSEPEGRRAFRDEVRAMGRLDHPNVVRVLDYGEVRAGGRLPAGAPWLAMELVDGGSLGAARLGGWGALRAVVEQILDALAHAHAHGVVHRDIKPPNVLLAQDGDGTGVRVVLSDFGIAWALDHREDRTPNAGSTAGTPSYMAPEQILDRAAAQGPWTDLYAVGCVAFRAVSGRAPFRRKDVAATLRAHLYDSLPPLVPRFPVPAGLWTWLGRMTQKDVTLRYRFAADAAHALRGIEDAEPELPDGDDDDDEKITRCAVPRHPGRGQDYRAALTLPHQPCPTRLSFAPNGRSCERGATRIAQRLRR